MNLKSIDESEFNRLLNKGGLIQNLRVTDEIKIINRGFIYKIKFVNCIFEKNLNISESNFFEELVFQNSEFKFNIDFKGVGFYKQFTFKDCIADKNITFINTSLNVCEFDNLICKQIIFKGDVKSIENEEGEISLKNGDINRVDFSSKENNCSIKLSSLKIKTLNFEKTNINKSVLLEGNLKIENLYIESSNFYDYLDFEECSIEQLIYIRNSNFYGLAIFRKKCYNKSLWLTNVYAKQNLIIDYKQNLDSLNITDCTFDSSFKLSSPYSNKDVEDDKSDGLTCNISGVIHGSIVFDNVSIPHLSIDAINFGNLIFNRIRVKFLFLQNFYNNNKLVISNVILDKYYNLLLIYDSNINDTEFINVNFQKFSEVVIAKSNVSNISLSNSLFPLKIATETKAPQLGYKIEPSEMINKYMYLRETYRQLKLAMEKQGHRYLALQYRTKEMHYLRKELKFGWDKVLLYLNYFSNNHGISWIRGIFFTITIGFFFFCIYNTTLPIPSFYWNLNSSFEETKAAFSIGLNGYANFLASFPKLIIKDNSNTWQTNLCVLASRIFIGYGIYQTIISFRKYGGK